MLTDSHCHLDFLKDPQAMIIGARDVGVTTFITPGVSAQSSQACVALASENQGVFAAVGLHPIDVASQTEPIDRQLQAIEVLLRKGKEPIVAIGETGLNFCPPPSGETARSKYDQIRLLESHIQLAIKYDLPLIIHNRKAGTELITTLLPFKERIKGVFHCFAGSKAFAKQIVELGFYVGVTGLVTYDQGLQEVVKQVPIDRLLIETDSPYLMPEPIRQEKRWPNEPKNVKIVAEKIAQLRGDSFLAIAQQTSQNAKKLFKLN